MTALEIWLQESSTNTHVGEIPPGQNLPQVKTNCNKSKYLHSFHLRNKFTFDSGHAQLKWCTERTHVNCPKRRPLVRICPLQEIQHTKFHGDVKSLKMFYCQIFYPFLPICGAECTGGSCRLFIWSRKVCFCSNLSLRFRPKEILIGDSVQHCDDA